MNSFIRFYRFFRRHAVQSSINLFGLAFGMGVFLTIQLYIFNERDYDRFWEGHENIYRISAEWDMPDGHIKKAAIPPPIAPYISSNAGLEGVTRLVYWSDFTLRPDTDSSRIFRETKVYQADPTYFDVFQGRLKYGNEETAFNEMFSVLLTESTARRYFGDMPLSMIVGRSLLGGKDAGTIWKITGILEDLPENSHMDFDMLIPMWDEFAQSQIWSWHIMHTYVRVNESMPEESMRDMLDRVVTDRIIPHYVQEGTLASAENDANFRFTPLAISGIHLQPDWEDSMRGSNRESYLEILNYVSLLVFILACINFINISTSLAFYRTAEIGIRKIHGSSAFRLFLMVLTEFLIGTTIALLLALCINEVFLIGLDRFFDVVLHVSPTDVPEFMLQMVLVVLLISILASGYPAYLLARGKSIRITRGSWRIGYNKLFRDGLIVFQFFIAIFLIGFTLTVNRQLDYMQGVDLGFERDGLLVIQNDREIEEERNAFTTRIMENPQLEVASFATSVPAQARYQGRDAASPGSHESFPVQWYEADENYMAALKLELIDGENFKGMPSDSGLVLINESAAELFDIEAPIGQTIIINEGAPDEHRVTVSGIIRNFNHEGFRAEVAPLVIEYLDNFTFKDYAVVRYSGNPSEILPIAESVWHEFEPEVPMTYSFLQSDFQQLFNSEIMLSRVFRFFSVLSLVIASLGLLGVSSVAMEQQTREIGIRKVFGASSAQLIIHQLRRFIILVVIGLLLAIPVSWITSRQWLQEFVFRTELNVWVFVVSALAVLIITVIVVGLRSWYGTNRNPMESLRTE